MCVVKRWLPLICILLLLGFAHAEEMRYTLHEDIYYHTHPNCGGREAMVPLSDAAAAEFQKAPCPNCFPVNADMDARAMVRGGTIVVRIPQTWLDRERQVQGVFAAAEYNHYEGDAMYARLSELLHGEAYAAFMDAYMQDDHAETIARVPDIIWPDGDLIMNERHLGGAYYIVLRPAAEFDDSYTTYMRFFEYDLSLKDGVLEENMSREWVDNSFEITLHRTGGNAVHTAEIGNLSVTVFREMDTNIAVITERNADRNFISYKPLHIGNVDTGVRVSGYMEGTNAVYCCVLTDAELGLLQKSAALELVQADLSDAEFFDTPYAVVCPDGERKGLIDANREFLLGPAYTTIMRTELEHIFVGMEDVSWNTIVFNAAEGRIVATLDKEYYGGSFGWHDLPEIVNEKLFMVDVRSEWRVHDLNNGAMVHRLKRFDEVGLAEFAAGY